MQSSLRTAESAARQSPGLGGEAAPAQVKCSGGRWHLEPLCVTQTHQSWYRLASPIKAFSLVLVRADGGPTHMMSPS
jgi:hypothetical protein